jgi:hypothetical protein
VAAATLVLERLPRAAGWALNTWRRNRFVTAAPGKMLAVAKAVRWLIHTKLASWEN